MEEQPLTKKQRRKLLKQEKLAQEETIQRKEKKMSAAIAIVSFVGLIALGWGLIRLAQRTEAAKPGQKIASQGNKHIQPGDPHEAYNTIPPTSGPHTGTVSWGNHIDQIPDEAQLHNLEDAGVGIQYDCDKKEDSCNQLISKLLEISSRYPDKVFIGPYKGIGNRIALTAWQRIDKFDEFDEKRIVAFINAYKGIDHHVGGGG